MYTFEFQSKLRRLNSDLYLGGAGREVFGWKAVGLYVRRNKRDDFGAFLRSHAGADEAKYLEMRETGALDEFICGVPAEWVPEVPVFDPKTRRLAAPDWRSIVLKVVKKGLCSMQRARTVFSEGSLGERDFAHLTFDEKRDLVAPVEDRLAKFREVHNAK